MAMQIDEQAGVPADEPHEAQVSDAGEDAAGSPGGVALATVGAGGTIDVAADGTKRVKGTKGAKAVKDAKGLKGATAALAVAGKPRGVAGRKPRATAGQPAGFVDRDQSFIPRCVDISFFFILV